MIERFAIGISGIVLFVPTLLIGAYMSGPSKEYGKFSGKIAFFGSSLFGLYGISGLLHSTYLPLKVSYSLFMAGLVTEVYAIRYYLINKAVDDALEKASNEALEKASNEALEKASNEASEKASNEAPVSESAVVKL